MEHPIAHSSPRGSAPIAFGRLSLSAHRSQWNRRPAGLSRYRGGNEKAPTLSGVGAFC